MAWEIVSDEEVAKFIRVPLGETNPLWYEMSIGLIESHTNWSLTQANNIVEKINGLGADSIRPNQIPIAGVTSLYVNGSLVPSSYYNVQWDLIQLVSYRPLDVMTTNAIYSINYFPQGTGNIEVTYNCGGYNALPNKYKQAIKTCILMVCKEFSMNFRGEGSDQMMRKYRPDRTMNPEEVLMSYGQHGKIKGIIATILPMHRNYA